MIKARLYINSSKNKKGKIKKGIMLNLTGDIEEIKINNRETLIVKVENEGRELRIKPWDDIKI
jgi:hypothetical protein